MGPMAPLEATSRENIDRQFRTNVLGVLYTAKAVIPHFRSRHTGMIINVGSMVGKVAVPLGTLYNSSKFAVEGLSEALSYEMEAIGVKVKIIEPGSVKTDFAGRSFSFNNDESLSEYQDVIQAVFKARGNFQEAGIPPEQVAEVIFKAANEEGDRLRYPVGPDAEYALAERKKLDDAACMELIRSSNGVSRT